jgi:hypothetical protein
MKEQIDNVIKWIKDQPVKGCITGSCLLDYFEGQDVDVFLYDDKQFAKLLFAMYYNDKFTILDPLERWKCERYINTPYDSFKKFGLTTIKFHYNTCVEVNIIVKKTCEDIFSVMSSFDMDIITKGYDIETKQFLDLSEKRGKIATWNKWNTAFYSGEVWQINRILRQLERCFKYYKRGYNVDEVVQKYIELIEKLQEFTNIFSSENFTEKLKISQSNTLIVKQICEKWLETHEITDEQLELLKIKIKEI